jgi:ATP-dependent RNA helicase RhlE
MKLLFRVTLWLSTVALCRSFLAPLSRISSSRLLSSPSEEEDNNDDANDNDIKSFAELGLMVPLLNAVKSQSGWNQPTPVQQLAIPKLLQLATKNKKKNAKHNNKNDDQVDAVWCEAPTGSGKTGAYVLPLLQNLQEATQVQGRISALILCPTRELAVQIGSVVHNIANSVASKRRQNVMVMYGGIPLKPQIATLADYAKNGDTLDILVATPGRLVDVLTYYQSEGGESSAKDAAMERRLLDAMDEKQGGSDVSLSLEQLRMIGLDGVKDDGRSSLNNLLEDLQYLVLDEADRLLGQAFKKDLDAVLDLLPSNTPTWMFSATFPKSIEPRLDQVLTRIGARTPIRIECASSDRLLTEDVSSSLQKKLDQTTTVSTASKLQKVGPASTIDLRAIRLEKRDRTQALRRLLKDHPEWDRVLVFVATRYAAEHVTAKLRRAGILASELHGKLDQDARMRRLADLKKGKIRVLLTTDVASRGIDIVGLPVMFNYDLPRSTADFVHRVGRTGRAGKQGTAISFVTAPSEAHMELIESRHLPEPIEREILPGFEPNESKWSVEAEGSRLSTPGAGHSETGLAHDRMNGGVKGYKKSKKDKLREDAARKAAKQAEAAENS